MTFPLFTQESFLNQMVKLEFNRIIRWLKSIYFFYQKHFRWKFFIVICTCSWSLASGIWASENIHVANLGSSLSSSKKSIWFDWFGSFKTGYRVQQAFRIRKRWKGITNTLYMEQCSTWTANRLVERYSIGSQSWNIVSKRKVAFFVQ